MVNANGPLCRLIEWMHRHCSGTRSAAPETPIALREASHKLNNEVMILRNQIELVIKSANDVSGIVDRSGSVPPA